MKSIKYLPEFHNLNLKAENVGVILDTETTSLINPEIISYTALRFSFTDNLEISNILNLSTFYNEPSTLITDEITSLTGITNDMVRGKVLTEKDLQESLQGAEVVIAHNAFFDRNTIENRYNIPSYLWACSASDIPWKSQEYNFMGSTNLEYLAYKHGFYFNPHSSEEDCKALLYLLSMNESKHFQTLMINAMEPRVRISCKGSPYDMKDNIKGYGFRWNGDCKEWWIETPLKNEALFSRLEKELFWKYCSLNDCNNDNRFLKLE